MGEPVESQAQPAMTPQQERLSDTVGGGALQLYKEFAVGADCGLLGWIWYEVLMFFVSSLAGVMGFAVRALLYPSLFKICGKRPAIGRGVQVRIPKQISIGKGILIDDYAVLDVRGRDASIDIEDRVSIGRYTTIAAKNGHIKLQSGVNIGSYCRVATNSKVEIGSSTLVGAYCYIGPGNHTEGDESTPLISRPMDIKGGVTIGEHSWLGARVTVLDGVKIGKRAIIGAHSLVKDDVPDWGVAVGVPAKVVKIRS